MATVFIACSCALECTYALLVKKMQVDFQTFIIKYENQSYIYIVLIYLDVFEEVLKYGNQNQKHRNKILAVGTTYLISSILHGLEKRLSAVLLSLAAYTYVEHHFRSKLALRFPRSLSCSKKDYHSVKYLSSSNKSTWFLWCINIMFTFLNIIHLAYLGSVMDMSGNMNTNQDSFALWRQTSFFSHIIMLFMFFISIIL